MISPGPAIWNSLMTAICLAPVLFVWMLFVMLVAGIVKMAVNDIITHLYKARMNMVPSALRASFEKFKRSQRSQRSQKEA